MTDSEDVELTPPRLNPYRALSFDEKIALLKMRTQQLQLAHSSFVRHTCRAVVDSIKDIVHEIEAVLP